MSATLPVTPSTSEAAEYRFRFGWRYVPRTKSDGTSDLEMVPLTLEDALHPQEEDHYMISDPHTHDCNYLQYVFESRVSEISGAIILADCRVAWDEEGTYAHGPDVAVIFNVAHRKLWRTFNTVHEGTRPSLIVEVTSDSTRVNDVERKVVEYAEAGVPRYVIVDADESNETRTISFIHYQLPDGASEYEELPISANGRVWLPEVRLWLGEEEGQVACFDTRGRKIPNYVELDRTLTELDSRAEAAEQRAEAAEQAITTEVEARMADLRARKDAERAVVEKDKLIAQMQAELERLRSGNLAAP